MKQAIAFLGVLAACGEVNDMDIDAGPDDASIDVPIDVMIDVPDMDMGVPPDPDLIVDLDSRMGVTLSGASKVMTWTDQSLAHADATAPATPTATITSVNATVGGASRPVLRFDAASYLIAQATVPAAGTAFVLYANTTTSGRLIGWESFASGNAGIGLEVGGGTNKLALIARKGTTATGDLQAVDGSSSVYELDVISWGPAGTTLERHKTNTAAVEAKANATFTMITDGAYKFHIGSSGDQLGLFKGDLAIVRVYKRQMSATDRAAIAAQLMP